MVQLLDFATISHSKKQLLPPDILSDIFWHVFWHSLWHSIWRSIWHSIWRSVWHICWHSIWHFIWDSAGHSIWHSIWAILWHSNSLFGIYSGISVFSPELKLAMSWHLWDLHLWYQIPHLAGEKNKKQKTSKTKLRVLRQALDVVARIRSMGEPKNVCATRCWRFYHLRFSDLIIWLVVDLPLWKIWVRQWKGWHPIYEMEN